MSQARADIAIIGLAVAELVPNAIEAAAADALADAGYGAPAKLADLRQRTAVITAISPAAPDLAHHLTSARLAQQLDLTGPAYVVDAASAPDLVALDLAANELRGGRCDLALAGAAHDLQAGMLVLKRLEDAERAGDRIYAVIKSVGASAPAGGASPANGIAGLIQTALALHQNPNHKLGKESNFYRNSEAQPGMHGSSAPPQRAEVSAFGSGIHAHAVLETYTGAPYAAGLEHAGNHQIVVISGETQPELLAEAERVQALAADFSDGRPLQDVAWTLNCSAPKPSRLTIVAASRQDFGEKLACAIERLRDERTTHIQNMEGVYYCSRPPDGQVALVCPGPGAPCINLLADLRLLGVPVGATIEHGADFRAAIEALYRDGVRIFIDLEPHGRLCGLIDEILPGQDHWAVPASIGFEHLLAQLVAHGIDARLPQPFPRRDPYPPPVRLPRDLALATSADLTPVIEQHFRTMARFLELEKQVMTAYLAQRKEKLPERLAPAADGPFITEVLELTRGVRVRAQHRFSIERERLFADHTLGRNLSQEDPELAGLPVVPLTIFMEIMAEAGALLEPGQVLAGMRDFRAYRWITLEEPGVTIELMAEQREPGAVYVTMRESRTDDAPRPVWAEGLLLFTPEYPLPGPPEPFTLEHERGSRWTPDRLYVDGMLPGPLFQAIKSMDRTGSNGATCTLEVPRRDTMIAGQPQPAFLLDPVTLNAAGQVVAFWSQEQLDPTGDIFPYGLASLDCYGPPPAPGERLECRAAVTHAGDKDLRSDIEILDAQGRLLYRIRNWEDRRFSQTPEFWQLRIAPRESSLSNVWNEPVAAFRHQPLVCCRLDSFSREFFEASHGIWLKALAYMVLSRRERQQWLSMRAVDKRKREWLLGRCAAKDAVRRLLEKYKGVQLAPADVEIVADPYGAPRAEGAWTRRLRIQPSISISHTRGTAVALAALDSGQLVGIDLECLDHRREDFETVAFSAEERKLLAAIPPDLRQEWALRMWCAKESVAKALGRGLAAGMHAFCITGAELDTGIVQLELRDGALDQFPHLRGKAMIAYTARETDFVFSTLIYQQGVVQ